MKQPALALLIVALAATAPLPALAQDGPIRQWLKERRQQPAPAADTNTSAPITAPSDHTYAIQHGGLTRMYRVHVPARYNPATPAALLVALHGGGADMSYQADDAHYGLISASERQGFVAVFPNGYSKLKSGKLATWNAGRCCGGARDENIDDVGFIRQVVANLTRQMNIDRRRIYATGMSNGGLMAYRLACEAADVFAAIAPVAGTDNTRSCNPSRAVSVLHIHAKNDDHVLFNGGAGPGNLGLSLVTDFTSVPNTMAKWARLNGCNPTPRRTLDKPGAYCEVYAPCRDQAEVQLCVTERGGHSWPGGHKPRAEEPPSTAISADEVMWAFFSQH